MNDTAIIMNNRSKSSDDFKSWIKLKMEKTEGIDIYNIYSDFISRHKALRGISSVLGKKFLFPFDGWKSKKAKYKTIIIFDQRAHADIVEAIRKANPDSRIIMWLWNYRVIEKKRKACVKNNIEIYSFDKSVCEEGGFKYNHQFYFFPSESEKLASAPNNSTYFCGANKGRFENLCRLYDSLISIGENPDINVVSTKLFPTPENNKYADALCKEKRYTYAEILENSKNCKCIIDVAIDNQQGLTLRVMEALFLDKKLISGNTDLVNYPFYNKNNIFIIEDFDNIDEKALKEFMDLPFEAVADSVKEQYTFEHWLRNF